MFIGHFGVGFGAKKYAPTVSLAILFLAAQFLDLLWPTLLLLDVEHVTISPGITKMTPLNFTDYPITHSLLMAIAWGLLFAALAWLITKKNKISLILGLCVLSHWLLDFLVHRPDLPLTIHGSTKVGLSLWNMPVVEIIVEGAIFLLGVYLYVTTTSPKNRWGKYGLAFLVIFFIVIQVGNFMGPPPPDVTAIAWAGQLQWIFVILAFFVDKHRSAKS